MFKVERDTKRGGYELSTGDEGGVRLKAYDIQEVKEAVDHYFKNYLVHHTFHSNCPLCRN